MADSLPFCKKVCDNLAEPINFFLNISFFYHFSKLQHSSTIKKRPQAKPTGNVSLTGMTKPETPDQPVNPVIIATESDLINQAISGSPRTARKLNNKFLEVILFSDFFAGGK